MSTETIVEPPKLIPKEILEKIAAQDDLVAAILNKIPVVMEEPISDLPPIPSPGLSEEIRQSDEAAAQMIEAQVAVGPEAIDDALDDLEKDLAALPLEDGVVKSDDPPPIETSSPFGSIVMNGKSYDVCQPAKVAATAQDPLYLLIEKTVGVSLRDAEKLLVFDWGLLHLKNRAPFSSEDGKRVLAMIQATL